MTAGDRRRCDGSRKATVGLAGRRAGRLANGCGWRGRPLGTLGGFPHLLPRPDPSRELGYLVRYVSVSIKLLTTRSRT